MTPTILSPQKIRPFSPRSEMFLFAKPRTNLGTINPLHDGVSDAVGAKLSICGNICRDVVLAKLSTSGKFDRKIVTIWKQMAIYGNMPRGGLGSLNKC